MAQSQLLSSSLFCALRVQALMKWSHTSNHAEIESNMQLKTATLRSRSNHLKAQITFLFIGAVIRWSAPRQALLGERRFINLQHERLTNSAPCKAGVSFRASCNTQDLREGSRGMYWLREVSKATQLCNVCFSKPVMKVIWGSTEQIFISLKLTALLLFLSFFPLTAPQHLS